MGYVGVREGAGKCQGPSLGGCLLLAHHEFSLSAPGKSHAAAVDDIPSEIGLRLV